MSIAHEETTTTTNTKVDIQAPSPAHQPPTNEVPNEKSIMETQPKSRTRLNPKWIFLTSLQLIGLYVYGNHLNSLSNERPIRVYFAHFHHYTNFSNDPTALPSEVWSGSGVYAFGGLFSAVAQANTSHFMGRKIWTIIALCTTIVGAILKTISAYTHIGLLFFGRFLDGVASAAFPISTVLLILESIPRKLSNFYKSLIQPMVLFGMTAIQVISIDEVSDKYWNFIFLEPAVFSVILLALCIFHPESPKYVYVKTRNSAATINILKQLRGDHYDEKEFNSIKESVVSASRKVMGVFTLIKKRKYRLPLLTLIILNTGRQLSGALAITTFGPRLLVETGFPRADLGGILLTGISFVGGVLAIFLITKIHKKFLYMTGLTILNCLLYSYFICTYGSASPEYQVALLALCTAIVPAGVSSIPWIISVEMFPTSATAAAQSAGITFAWLSNILLFLVSPIGFDKLGDKYLFVFTSYGFLVTVYCLFFMVETHKKTLDQVLKEYQRLVGWNEDLPKCDTSRQQEPLSSS